MCGLCGVISSKLTTNQYKIRNRIIDSLLIQNESRGEHSTGIAAISNSVNLVKKTLKATDFIENTDYINLMRENSDIIIGHTRFATMGKVTEDNAHPYIKGSIIGAHNGIISNHWELDKSVNVDSEAIFSHLDKNKNDFKKALPEIEGSFALSWSNLKNLYLVAHRNPLAIAFVPELKSIFWSSEFTHLLASITAAVGINHTVLDMPEDTVYTINRGLQVVETEITMPLTDYGNYGKTIDSRPDYQIPDEFEDYPISMLNCTICGFEFEAEEKIYYDFMKNELYCVLCQRNYPIKSLEVMTFREFLTFGGK